jgi:hypothetical protein
VNSASCNGVSGERRSEVIQRSLAWLDKEAPGIVSVSSLAWCILTLFVYQESVEPLKNKLAAILGDGRDVVRFREACVTPGSPSC